MKLKPLVIALLMFSSVGAQAQARHSRRSINPAGPVAASVAAQAQRPSALKRLPYALTKPPSEARRQELP
jgi:hypothetical protein